MIVVTTLIQNECLCSYWIILKNPREVKIHGAVLKNEFQKHAVISIGTFAAIVRLLQCQ
jgi:hypothetical protein